MACAAGHCGTVEVLIKAAADLRAPDLDNAFPLNRAAHNGHLDVVRILLDAGAEIDAADIMGRTALHDAAENGHAEIVQLLVGRGADQTRTCRGARNSALGQHAHQNSVAAGHVSKDLRALDLAAQNSHHDVVQIFVQSVSQPINVSASLSVSEPTEVMVKPALVDLINQQVSGGITKRLKRE